MGQPRKVHFKTHSDLKNVIGQDLINDDNIAIVELVKNGLDAGANSVKIEFLTSGSAIIIEDNGSGMSEQDIEDKWLNIAYSEKKKTTSSSRILAGNKGVGRFACDRLGSKLDMYTRKNKGVISHLTVDWTEFEDKENLQSTIQKIDIKLNETTDAEVIKEINRKVPKTGTLLVITDLRQNWNREKLMLLKRNLERFVNPIAVFDKSSVDIEMIADDELVKDHQEEIHNQINSRIENQVFSKLKFNTTYIESTIDSTGTEITTELFHEGRRVYRLVEDNIDFKLLKNVHVVMHYMNPYKKGYFKRQTGLHLVEFGSVFLFINGYRVPPYGDRNNDWLQLDNRKAQGNARRLGSRELLGLIDIKDSDRQFRIVSNREGVARDEIFAKLISVHDGFFVQVLSKFEKFVVDGLKWDSVPEEISNKMKSGVLPGDKEMPGEEVYTESNDLKRRRIALDVLRIVGASPARTRELEIDPDVLDALSREREEEVSTILEKFNAFNGIVGHDVKLALNRVEKEFKRQKESLLQAQKDVNRKNLQVSRLKDVARGISREKKDLEKQVKTQQTELHFSRLSAGTDHEQLMLLHHQSAIYANTAKNFLDKTLTQLRQEADIEKIFDSVEKALLSTRKIIAITSFATKANFKLKTETMTADVASFIQEYLENVASNTSAQNLKITVNRDFSDPFVMRFKPIDIAIVFDNLASNSTRVRAKRLNVNLHRVTENELEISVHDNGPGLDKHIQPPEKIFDKGVTTTNGSGLGLYHVKQTIKQLNGDITLDTSAHEGFGVLIRLFK